MARDPADSLQRRDNPTAPLGYEYWTTYEFDTGFGSGDGISVIILLILAEIRQREGHEPTDDLLIDAIDPDALDGLFRPVMYRTDRNRGRVTFAYDGFDITAHADGEIVVQPRGPLDDDGDGDATGDGEGEGEDEGEE